MLELLEFEFMRNAVIAGILASIACGVVGSYVVTNRIVFISGGISHTAFGGIGLGYLLGINPIWGAIVFTLAAAVAIGAVSKKTGLREDTTIGIMWAVGMALGVIFIRLTPGYTPDLFSYLFGNILTVPSSDVILMLFLDVLILGAVALLYKQFLALSFDEEFASIVGIPTERLHILLLCLIALTVVLLIRIVGIILVIALLSIPAAIASQYTSNLKRIMLISVLLGVVFTAGGLSISYWLDLASGATIILVAAVGFVIASVAKGYRRAAGARA
jgi:zinc transport system permease protein